MATLSPNILLAQNPVKMPSLDFSQTFVDIAKIKAYQQQQRLAELKYGQEERGYARDEEFNRLAAGLFTPSQAPPAAAPQRGLAGGPPQASAGPPQGPPMGQGPGPWASGYGDPSGPPLASANPGMPPGGGGMPPGIPQPTSMEPGTFMNAQGTPPSEAPVRGLAGGPPSAPPGGVPAPPPPGEPPQGLGTAQPGAPKSLLQPINEDVLMRLYAANPEKASKLMEGHLGMQTKKLEQAEKMNEQIYQTLSALERDPNPAARYPDALASLKERGIPIPASFPREYNAALIQFKLREHETLKNQLDTAKVEVERQRAANEKAQAGLNLAKTGAVPSEIEANKALTGQRTAQAGQAGAETGLATARTGAVATQIDADKALAEQRRAQAALDKARATGIPADIKAAEALVGVRNAEAELAQARTKGVPADIKAAEALVQVRQAEAARIPLQGQRDVAETEHARQQTADLVEQRKAKAGQVTEYTKDSDWNVYLSQAMKEAGLPPGTSPNDHPEVIGKARQYQVEDKQNVVRKTGMDAIQRQQGPAATKRLEASNAKGSASENVVNVLDEVDRLIDEGVYENVPEEAAKQALFWAGLRPDDAKAARTKRLYELGNQLTVSMAPNGSLGSGFSEGDRQTFEKAGGDLQKNQAALSRKETIKSMRHLAKINMHDANHTWETHDKSGNFPRFGAAREERLKILTPERLEEVWQARKAGWSGKEALRQHLLGQGWREE